MESSSSNIKFTRGDLLDFTEEYYICHQCNCMSKMANGLSRQIFDQFPNANTYTFKERVPGTIAIIDKVINLYGQVFPGAPRNKNDNTKWRLEYFESCLEQLDKQMSHDDNIAFPYNIGCGLAKGKWTDYLKLIINFQKNLYQEKF